MSVPCPAIGIRYYPVPKVACTSIKQALYEINHGSLPATSIHTLYPSPHFARENPAAAAADIRIAVVRDPIDRLVSAYRNRVQGHQDAAHWKLRKAGLPETLPPFPRLNDFVDNLEAYQAQIPAIRHHTEPMVRFLGNDPAWFHHIFWMDELPAFERLLSDRLGRQVRFQRAQTRGPRVSISKLGESQREKLLHHYAADYAFLARLDG